VCVIEVCVTDDDGNLWFRVNKPYDCIDDLEQSFPALLHFYNKVISYYIAVHGKATIMDHIEDTTSTISLKAHNCKQQYAFIKFKILSAEYFYSKNAKNNHSKYSLNTILDKIFLTKESIIYRF